ncbi:aspartate/glutamate racemase family protein [Chloroflexota bacterium]
MKIWCQTGGPLSVPLSTYQQTLKEHLQEVASPDTIVDLRGVKQIVPGPDRYHSAQHVRNSWVIGNAIQAEREGYDAFAIVNTLDPGFYEVRELVDIPVAFIRESSLHLACLLAPKFACVTHNSAMLLRQIELANRYGLAQRMTPGGQCNISYAQFEDMDKNPKPYISAFTEKAREVIEQGADILLISGNPLNMFLVNQGIREVDGVPILDSTAAVIKTAEMMVDLKTVGISRSKHGLYAPPSAEDLVAIRKLYTDE